MFRFSLVNWFWRPVGVGRHAFDVVVRQAGPHDAVFSFCGVEVEAWQVQRLPSEIEWIEEATCMTCWREITSRLAAEKST
ncbi:hypothetical protein [Saccharopolyspora rosea]|uniref:Zinc-finger n=1 Tax=Saccharopolyspora rosea TaxID=524884 RepID=A0ABW3FLZ7_9PSEU|nr:hypothetical protein [Saccharopolyspora rosea]